MSTDPVHEFLAWVESMLADKTFAIQYSAMEWHNKCFMLTRTTPNCVRLYDALWELASPANVRIDDVCSALQTLDDQFVFPMGLTPIKEILLNPSVVS